MPASTGKPYPDFPLYRHQTGRWAKKVKGHTLYFGPVSDPDGALARWIAYAANMGLELDIRERMVLRKVIDRFLAHKRAMEASGELAHRTVRWYEITCDFLLEVWGPDRLVDDLGPDDFQLLRLKLAERWGPVQLANKIQSVRTLFSFAYELGLINVPLRYGPGFKKPSAKVIRQQRNARGPRVFEPKQVKDLIDVSPINFKAMILLAINGGLGPADLAVMPMSALDLKDGWLNYPRPKTGVPRRIPLWGETVRALKGVLVTRIKPTNPASRHLVFIGPRGQNYTSKNGGNRITGEIRRLFELAKITGRTFYDFRRTFQTVAEEAGDLAAVQHIMGHAPSSGDMSAVYRQLVTDARLLKVVNHVHDWVYGEIEWPAISSGVVAS